MKRLKIKVGLWLLALTIGLHSCSEGEPQYKDATLSIDERVDDLMSRMTLDEKLAQMRHIHGGGFMKDGEINYQAIDKVLESGDATGCIETFLLSSDDCAKVMNYVQAHMLNKTRLGIPLLTVTESLHGSVQDGSTIFPQAIAMGSTFDPILIGEMASAIAKELKAQGIRQSLTPVLDVGRDMRWGRIEECFGEDPFLISMIGDAQVKGYMNQGVSPMIKHFGAHSEPTGGINLSSVSCSERELRSIHLKPFEYVVRNSSPLAVMSSYNSCNNVPNSGSRELLTDILRKEWGFQGYVYSDWGSIGMLNYFHNVAQNRAEAAMLALKAGIDLEASDNCYAELKNLIEKGHLDQSYVDTAVRRILRTKFALGLFEWTPSTQKDLEVVNSPEHIALARKIAEESIVLMQNDDKLLPLDLDKIKSIALVGPNADQIQFGDYTWSRHNKDGITIRRALEESIGDQVNIHYAQGCDIVSQDKSGFKEAIKAAKQSDVTIVVVGSASASLARDYSNATCGEGFDLHEVELTGVQEELIKTMKSNSKEVIVVLLAGKPFAMPWVKDNIATVITQWYSGEQGGIALANVLTGKVNPSGRLSYSFPRSSGHIPCFYNYLPTDKGFYKQPGQMDKAGKDYVFSSPSALWNFGHGLSYTTFDYSDLATNKTNYAPTDTIQLSVNIKNSGKVDGKEVVQVYVRDLFSSTVTPIHELRGFKKVFIPSGETTQVQIAIPVTDLAIYDINMNKVVEPGEFELQVGKASDNILLKSKITVDKDKMITAPLASDTEKRKSEEKKIVVTGVIRDIQANILPNVEVVSEFGKVKTNAKGEYKITADANGKLSININGKNVMKQPVNGNKLMNITVRPK